MKRMFSVGGLLLVALLCLAKGSALARVPESSATAMGLAIGDFDGDLRADIAQVQTGKSVSGTTSYYIELQLSGAGRESIKLVAPIGGLHIEARDVNGDRAIDLVLSTVWLEQPVAILLNDGHGNFSRVEPNRFSAAFRRSRTNWTPADGHDNGAIGAPSQFFSGILEDTKILAARSPQGILAARAGEVPSATLLLLRPGRAPPFSN